MAEVLTAPPQRPLARATETPRPRHRLTHSGVIEAWARPSLPRCRQRRTFSRLPINFSSRLYARDNSQSLRFCVEDPTPKKEPDKPSRLAASYIQPHQTVVRMRPITAI